MPNGIFDVRLDQQRWNLQVLNLKLRIDFQGIFKAIGKAHLLHFDIELECLQFLAQHDGIGAGIVQDQSDQPRKLGQIGRCLLGLIHHDEPVDQLRQLNTKCGFICARNAAISVRAIRWLKSVLSASSRLICRIRNL